MTNEINLLRRATMVREWTDHAAMAPDQGQPGRMQAAEAVSPHGW